MPSEARLRVVRQCVEQLWESRRDGRWSALECALIVVLSLPPPPRADASPERRKTQRRKNVIDLRDYLDKRRGERRRP